MTIYQGRLALQLISEERVGRRVRETMAAEDDAFERAKDRLAERRRGAH